MTAREFLAKHGIPNTPTQYSPQFQTDVNDTVKALDAYHQAKLKLLSITNVVGQSEQLPCDCSTYPTYFDKEQKPRCKNCNKRSWLAR